MVRVAGPLSIHQVPASTAAIANTPAGIQALRKTDRERAEIAPTGVGLAPVDRHLRRYYPGPGSWPRPARSLAIEAAAGAFVG